MNKADKYKTEFLPVFNKVGIYQVFIQDKEGTPCHAKSRSKKKSTRTS
jgi:hypothetical protein